MKNVAVILVTLAVNVGMPDALMRGSEGHE